MDREHGQHCLVGGGRGGQRGHLVPRDRFEQRLGAGRLDRHRGAAEAPGENQKHAEAEGEGDRRRAGPAIAGLRLQDVAGEAVGRGEDVAVVVDAALGASGGAGGEGDQRHVVAAGLDRDEVGRRFERLEAIVAIVGDHRSDSAGRIEIVAEAGVDDGVGDPSPLEYGGDLAWAKHRHGGDDDSAGLENAEPGGEQHRVVRPAQENAVAGDEAFLLHETARDPIREVAHLAVGPAAGIIENRERIRILVVDQLDGGVQPLGILELGQGEEKFGLRLGRGEAVLDEGIGHSGTTARVSISIFAFGSTSAVTPTTAMAGKCLPMISRHAAPISARLFR